MHRLVRITLAAALVAGIAPLAMTSAHANNCADPSDPACACVQVGPAKPCMLVNDYVTLFIKHPVPAGQ